MTSYELVIYVDSKLLLAPPPAALGNLCLAKAVDARASPEFNVVFQSRSDNGQPGDPIITHRNVLRWTDEYQVQGVENFATGVMVEGSTTARDILTGQACTYQSGDLGAASASTQAPSGGFAVRNLRSPLTAAVLQKAGGRFQYIFVDNAVLLGNQTEKLTPINSFLVFWDRQLTTNYMFADTVSAAFTFSVSGTDDTTKYIRWGYANPDHPHSASEEPVWSDYGGSDPFPSGENDGLAGTALTIQAALDLARERGTTVNAIIPKNIGIVRKALYNASHDALYPSSVCNLVFKDDTSLTATEKGKLVAHYLGVSVPPGFRIHFSRVGPSVTFDITVKAMAPSFKIIQGTTTAEQAVHIVDYLLKAVDSKYAPDTKTFNDPANYGITSYATKSYATKKAAAVRAKKPSA